MTRFVSRQKELRHFLCVQLFDALASLVLNYFPKLEVHKGFLSVGILNMVNFYEVYFPKYF